MIYVTPYDDATQQPTAASEPLPCATLDEAKALFGQPTSERPAMLLYQTGAASLCISRARIAIDPPDNSAYATHETANDGSNQDA